MVLRKDRYAGIPAHSFFESKRGMFYATFRIAEKERMTVMRKAAEAAFRVSGTKTRQGVDEFAYALSERTHV
jgi:hypothetical protein